MKYQCPNCGRAVEFDESREFMFCQYCGTKMSNGNPGGLFPPRLSSVPAGNVRVTYTTTRPEYPLSIVVDGERWTIPNNARQELTLEPGVHTVLFYVARRGWKKIVNVPFNSMPVRINVVYAGRVKIYIQ